jgi:16S rRNA (cytosine967-C5)-methyltransferase
MRNIGQVLAFDTAATRLDELKRRAARAGVSIINTLRLDGADDPRLARYAAKADLVLVDAPCSGTGTLRRSPDIKWRLRPTDVATQVALQARILASAARLVKPGGRLVYATCSVLNDENIGHLPLFDPDQQCNAGFPASLSEWVADRPQQWLPGRDDSDGFFVAGWCRQPSRRYNGG